MPNLSSRLMTSTAALTLPAVLGLALAAAPAAAQDAAQESGQSSGQNSGGQDASLNLTLYQGGFGVVHDRRMVDLPSGEVSIRLEDLARQVERDSLHVAGEGLRVIEQRSAGGDLGYRALLEAYVGEMVEVRRENPATGDTEIEEARLIAIEEGPVLQFEDRIEIEPSGRIVFPELPEGLSRAPYLDARLAVEEAGERPLDLWYVTGGLAWSADYTAVLDQEEGTLSLGGRARLVNQSGASFPDARISLVAGDVNRAGGAPRPQPMMRAESMMAADAGAPPEAQSSGGYYLYELEGPIALGEGASVQLPIIEADAVAFERHYRVEGLAHAERRSAPQGPLPAQMRLVIENSEEAGLGQPLPGGVLRVMGGAGQSMLLGEATIDHTPIDGELDVILGAAFDIQAEARELAFERLGEGVYETAHEITLTNAGGEAVEVEVPGAFPQGWSLIEESHPHEQQSATRPVWTIEVPAGGESVLTYRVRVER